MADWFGVIIFVFLLGLFISQIVSGEAEIRELRQIWGTFAAKHGWQFITTGDANVRGTITGIYHDHAITLTTYFNYNTRGGPAVYTDMIVSVVNLDGVILSSGLPQPRLNLSGRNTMAQLSKLKSGDGIFDASYTIKGAPLERVQPLINSYEVRSAIRALYPLNVAIFEHPIFALQDSCLRIRSSRLCKTETTLQRFIEKACHFADMLQETAQSSGSNQSEQGHK